MLGSRIFLLAEAVSGVIDWAQNAMNGLNYICAVSPSKWPMSYFKIVTVPNCHNLIVQYCHIELQNSYVRNIYFLESSSQHRAVSYNKVNNKNVTYSKVRNRYEPVVLVYLKVLVLC